MKYRKVINHSLIKKALTIRAVENKFLELFSLGKLNGTVHTCVGQEFSALAFAGQLEKRDFVFSNHRCHGHYLAFTNDKRGLLAELMGKASGTCGGVGSSQHLCNNNFFSNGIQGGIVPVAAGYALSNKLKKNGAVGVVYIGDGTLGEGAVYETFNIVSKWEIPLVIVCENNFYAQSTPQSVNLAGDILSRAEAFGIKTFKGDTWNPDNLMGIANEAIQFSRENTKPVFVLVETYRLNPHSKGDDDRNPQEIADYGQRDFLNIFKETEPIYYNNYQEEIDAEVNLLVSEIEKDGELLISEYDQSHEQKESNDWVSIESINQRQVELINAFFKAKMQDETRVFLGEDILSPYGGAFKVARDLSDLFPEQVFSTPISEAALMGISNGMALNGMKPYAEIMFGDFILLAMDQIVNHAAKFHHMYNGKANCPVVVRTAMGGHRGYGPTHSQSLEKFLIGIDQVKTVSLNTLLDPTIIYDSVNKEMHPVVVVENKIDYGKRILAKPSPYFSFTRSLDPYPVIRISPLNTKPNVTIVCHGGVADMLFQGLERIFKETDLIPEVIVHTLISKPQMTVLLDSVSITSKLLTIEESSATGGYGNEIISNVSLMSENKISFKRIGSMPLPIPSVRSLEEMVLPNLDLLINQLRGVWNV